MIDMSVLDGIIRNTRGNLETAMRKGYNQGYHDGQADANARINQKAYEKGLDDAWEAARKIFNMPCEDAKRLFYTVYYPEIISNHSAKEAMETLKIYETIDNQSKRFCNYIQKPCPYEIECEECEVYCSYDRACKRSEGENEPERT